MATAAELGGVGQLGRAHSAMMFFFVPFFAVSMMPPKESGTWIDGVFDWCVELLLWAAARLGISYNAINVWVFCIIWPVLTLWLIGLVLRQRAQIRRLRRNVVPGA